MRVHEAPPHPTPPTPPKKKTKKKKRGPKPTNPRKALIKANPSNPKPLDLKDHDESRLRRALAVAENLEVAPEVPEQLKLGVVRF